MIGSRVFSVSYPSLFFQWWNLIAAFSLVGIGIKTAIVWTAAKNGDDFQGSDFYARNYDAALGMAAMIIIAGFVYFLDFVVAFVARKRIARDYEEAAADGY